MKRLPAIFALLATPLMAMPEPAEISLLPGWRTDRGTVMAALRVNLSPGWKTYWRTPGEAGIPPLFIWDGSENLHATAIHWPTPRTYDSAGMRIVAYEGDVVIPIELHPQTQGPIHIALNLQMGLCHDICVPVTQQITATLDPGTRRDPSIVAALLSQPKQGQDMTCTLTPAPNGLNLTLHVPHPQTEAVIESPDADWISEPQTAATSTGMNATATLSGRALTIDRSQIRLTLLPQSGPAIEYLGCT